VRSSKGRIDGGKRKVGKREVGGGGEKEQRGEIEGRGGGGGEAGKIGEKREGGET